MNKIFHQIDAIIKSFTETEIRAYQRWIYHQQGETNHYVQFFNLIRKGQDIELLKKDFSSKNFSRIMGYLKESLYEFLIYYESNNELNFIKLQKQLILASKLKSKNLVDQSIACLEKILPFAKQNNYFELTCTILRSLSDSYIYNNQSQLALTYYNELQEINKEYIKYINSQKDLIFIKSTYREWLLGYSGVVLEPDLIDKFIQRNKRNSKSKYKQLALQSIFNLILLYTVNGNFKEEEYYLQLSYKYFDHSKPLYPYELLNLIVFYNNRKLFKSSDFYLQILDNYTSKYKQYRNFYHEILQSFLLLQGNYKQLLELEHPILFYKILANFHLGNFEHSKSKLQKVIHTIPTDNKHYGIYLFLILIINIKEEGCINKLLFQSHLEHLLKKRNALQKLIKYILKVLERKIRLIHIEKELTTIEDLVSKLSPAEQFFFKYINLRELVSFFIK